MARFWKCWQNLIHLTDINGYNFANWKFPYYIVFVLIVYCTFWMVNRFTLISQSSASLCWHFRADPLPVSSLFCYIIIRVDCRSHRDSGRSLLTEYYGSILCMEMMMMMMSCLKCGRVDLDDTLVWQIKQLKRWVSDWAHPVLGRQGKYVLAALQSLYTIHSLL